MTSTLFIRNFIFIIFVSVAATSVVQAQTQVEKKSDASMMLVAPSQVDSSIHTFNENNLVALPLINNIEAPLVLFLPGTGGRPENARLLISVIAKQGYRVIGLSYNNEPAVVQVCPKRPDPECSSEFRHERIFGGLENPPVNNTISESIVSRLLMLLRHLKKVQPNANWNRYLEGDEPVWSRIIVSGLSQGAGMAAYIAKKKSVARVVLFSSPWDFYGKDRQLAPWISSKSATPSERWFAAYHRRENTASLIAQSYALLAIPKNHIRVFDLDMPETKRSANPFHSNTIKNVGYVSDWKILYGLAGDTK
jgi:hypothetical protein